MTFDKLFRAALLTHVQARNLRKFGSPKQELRDQLGHEEWLRRHDDWMLNDPPLCNFEENVRFLQRRGADPELWHYLVGHGWNYDWGLDVPTWLAMQPDFDGSSASFLLICTTDVESMPSNRLECSIDNIPAFDMWFNLAQRWRTRSYPTRYGHQPYQQPEFGRFSLSYRASLAKLGNPIAWMLPDEAYGPFKGSVPPRPDDLELDDAGRFRRPFERWHLERYGF